MATTFSFAISCAEDRAGLASRTLTQAHHLIQKLEKEVSEFAPTSPIFKLNQALPMERIKLSQSGIDLLERAEQLRLRTSGAFDCAAKSAGLATGPSIGWDAQTGQAWRMHEGVHIGFGAIGKGYALDQARNLIEGQGFEDYLLSAGGSSLIFSGFANHNEPWNWGWSWNKDENGEALGIEFSHHSGNPIALGISGTHEKGQHLIDRTGRARTYAKSALVALPSAADADALSTALFITGFEESKSFLADSLIPAAAAEINEQGIPAWNGLFQKFWGSIGLLALATQARADESAVDLSKMGLDDFAPYICERNLAWILLPLVGIAAVLVHLKKIRNFKKKGAALQ